MTQTLHKTKGIVLRTVKYGDTSVIVAIYTELFGLQSYIVNGVRTSSKKSAGKASYFQPATLLDMVVYHNELKQINRIKEYRLAHLYDHIFSDIRKNAVALFMVELITKCLKQPEANPDLFNFIEDAFLHLDKSEGYVTANFPLFFAIHLPVFFGFRITMRPGQPLNYLDLVEGEFCENQPEHPHFLEDKQAEITSRLLQAMQPDELAEIKLNHETRRSLLFAYEKYYALHLQDFGTMKTLPILKEILS